ncbi:MAG: YitT family protein [Bacteroidales bacterium]|nr:YitT family protein [Bacteroidales bacterium]
MKINEVLKTIKEYILIAFGILIYVTGWTIFLVPNNLVGGGVTGISSILQYATGGAIRMGYTYFAINLMLLIIALFTLGKAFGIKTVFAIILASVGLNVLQDIIPADICYNLAVKNGKLLSTIIGGITAGVGIGMTMSQGGSTGGTDIIALVVNKYRNVSPGRMILAIDVVIIGSSIIVPSYTPDGELLPFTEKIVTVVYGLILTTVCSTVLDLYIAGSKQSVQVFILSKKYAEIADMITHDLHRGCTVLNGQGWYTKQETYVVMVLTRKSDLNLLLKMIKNIDSNAFLSVATVTGVYGQGFDAIKVKEKKNIISA